MSVKIDKYVQIVDESGLVGWIRDESNEKVIIKINMDSKDHTKQMLTLCLNALNTGEFETVKNDDGLGENDIIDVGDSDDGDDSIVDDESVNNGE